ncbi:MAG: hypothetical protein HKO66_05900 [Saprospiraceae bacterium]|nr:hypothetical protein [Saprospiraceae bacterium]NNL91744.1 hypothetical protein [Saprospiraceae bacterium]
MNTKLTLSIEQEIIEEAKKYAKLQGRSLSNIVAEYLKSLSNQGEKKPNRELSKIVKELKGSLKKSDNSRSYKEILEDALIEKYLK